MVVPLANAAEAAVVDGVPVFGMETLAQAVGFFNGTEGLARDGLRRAGPVRDKRRTMRRTWPT